jgi:hypothetical protein
MTNNGIRTRPVRRMTQAELDGFLEKAADMPFDRIVMNLHA